MIARALNTDSAAVVDCVVASCGELCCAVLCVRVFRCALLRHCGMDLPSSDDDMLDITSSTPVFSSHDSVIVAPPCVCRMLVPLMRLKQLHRSIS